LSDIELMPTVRLSHLIGYPISDIRKTDNNSLLIGQVIYMYWIPFRWPVQYIYHI